MSENKQSIIANTKISFMKDGLCPDDLNRVVNALDSIGQYNKAKDVKATCDSFGKIDKNNDGVLSVEELASIPTQPFSEIGLKSLSGEQSEQLNLLKDVLGIKPEHKIEVRIPESEDTINLSVHEKGELLCTLSFYNDSSKTTFRKIFCSFEI